MSYYDKSETLAQAMLDAIVAEYAATNVSVPDRQILGYAGMPFDCEMLSVMVVRMYAAGYEQGPDQEGIYPQRNSSTFWAGAEIDVVILRCTPQPKTSATSIIAVKPAVIEAFASLTMKDPHIIARGVMNAFTAGDLGLGGNLAFLDTAAIGDESGGFVGLRARHRLGLAV